MQDILATISGSPVGFVLGLVGGGDLGSLAGLYITLNTFGVIP